MRPRFSLRLFLIAFTLIAILFGGAAHFVYRIKDQARRHKAAVANLKEMGCKFGRDSTEHEKLYDNDRVVVFARKWIDPEAYSPSPPFSTSVATSSTKAREILGTARDLCDVWRITLNIDELTTEIIDQLVAYPSLKVLTVRVNSIELDAVNRLSELQSLWEFRITQPIPDDLARQLTDLSRLNSLQIDISKLSDAGAVHLSKLAKGCRVELHGRLDHSLPIFYLCQNAQLEGLIFRNCAVSDEALSALESASHLNFIRFHNCTLPQSLSMRLSKAPILSHISIESETPLTAQQLIAIPQCASLKSVRITGPMLNAIDLAAWRPPQSLTSFAFPGELGDEVILEFLKVVPECEIHMHKEPMTRIGSRSEYYREFKLERGELKTRDLIKHIFAKESD